MDFEKEIPFELDQGEPPAQKELTPMLDMKIPQTKGLRDGNTQYFTNIDGKYCKDVAGREELDELKALVDDVPWQPLEDGYSNFWFELTNDTLSPWLNFSAKTESAVIDWGDGSGEQSLDTLTPTHTYSKAGRYVVKCKGVTGIAAVFNPNNFLSVYSTALKNVELNSEVTSLNNNAFWRCFHLENIGGNAILTTFAAGATSYTGALKSFTPVINADNTQSCFYMCFSLRKVVLGGNVQSIANNSLYACYSLTEIHIRATTPPTLGGASIFTGLPSDFIIYVPVGYAETYKAASGWSTYADHILEEGQTPNRMMLAKFNSAKTDEPQDDMR